MTDKQNLPMMLKLCKSSKLGVINIVTYWAPGFWADRDSGLRGAAVCAGEEGRAGRGRRALAGSWGYRPKGRVKSPPAEGG